jgi:phospholipid N-methyltransferase
MPSRLHQTLLFARTFFKHPTMLGSLIPSSPYLSKHLLQQIDWDTVRVAVEYGPGVGTLTQKILERLRPDAVLLVIETQPDFVHYLRRSFTDPRLLVVHGSAAEVGEIFDRMKLQSADCIISGIPYTTLDRETREKILRESWRVLRPNGAFLVYQFTRAVLPYLRAVFGRVHQEFEPRNILPARIFYCVRS